MSEPYTTVTPVSDGVARLAWSPDEVIDVVRHELATALLTYPRVEALVDPDDSRAQRTATWAGMHREGIMRGVTVDGDRVDRILYARLVTDTPVEEPAGFRALLNSFLPRKRVISQMLVRDPDGRVLTCALTYKNDWDLPGGVVEVSESPSIAVTREIDEELSLDLPAGDLVIADWMPAWSGWDDAVCLVFDGGVHDPTILDDASFDSREIRSAQFSDLAEIREHAADFTVRRIEAALASLDGSAPRYVESGSVVSSP